MGAIVSEVPTKAVHPGLYRNLLLRRHQVRPLRRRLGPLLVKAGEFAEHRTGGIEDLQLHFTLGRRFEVVRNDRSMSRILTNRLAAIEELREVSPIHGGRFVEMDIGFRHVVRELSQRRDVIQNPEGPPMRRYDQIFVLYDQIMNGRLRQVQLQRLPVSSAIERNKDSGFRTGVE